MKRIPRRVIAIIAIWLVIVSIAVLRQTLRIQAEKPFQLFFSRSKSLNPFYDLAQKHPDNAAVWAPAAMEDYLEWERADLPGQKLPGWQVIFLPSPLFPGKAYDDFPSERRRRLRMVVDKFPDKPWVLCRYLRFCLETMPTHRFPLELRDSGFKRRPGESILHALQRKPYVYQPEVDPIIALCRRGCRMEKENAFFDFCLSYFLLVQGQDEEAWQSLLTLSRKKHWDDHVLEDFRNELAANTLLKNRPLSWEEKVMLYRSVQLWGRQSYGSYSAIVSWECRGMRKRHPQSAMQLMEALAKTGAIIRENSTRRELGEAGNKIERDILAWPWEEWGGLEEYKTRSEKFPDFARRHGHRRLAAWASQEEKRIAAYEIAGAKHREEYGISSFQAACLGIAQYLQWLLLGQLAGTFVAWSILALFLRGRLARVLLRPAEPTPEVTPGQAYRGALMSSGILPLCGVLAPPLGVLSLYLLLDTLWNGFGDARAALGSLTEYLWSNYVSSLEGSTISISITNQTLAAAGSTIQHNITFFWPLVACMPWVLGFLHCSDAALKWQGATSSKEGKSHLAEFAKAILTGRFFHQTANYDFFTVLRTSSQLPLRLIGILGLCIAGYYAVTLPDPDYTRWVALLGVLVCWGLLCTERFLAWRHLPRRRAALRYGMRHLYESWLTWLALGSALYLILLLGSYPIRNQADAAFARLIQYGEVAAEP